MLKDITLGQYFPGNSVVHRLDPRAKLLLLIVYIVALFVAVSWISYAVMLICLCTVIAISKIPPKAILRGMKPLVMILIFTAVLNIFFSQGETVLVSFWKLTITLEGLLRAVQMMVRHVSADLHHLAHCLDRCAGIPSGTPESHPCAGPRAEHDDVHCPALHPDFNRRNG